MANILSISLKTPQDVRSGLAARAKDRRLALNLSQEGLARRSGVSLGSLKRFERTGQVSLDSLLKLALVLEALDEFESVFKPSQQISGSLDDLLKSPPVRQKGRLK